MNNLQSKKPILRGQLYWAELDLNTPQPVGSMQSGRRPVIIFSNNSNNHFSDCVTVLPMTTANKKQLPTHEKLKNFKFGYGESTSLAECITTIDKRLLREYIGILTQEDIKKIELTIAIQLGLNLAS